MKPASVIRAIERAAVLRHMRPPDVPGVEAVLHDPRCPCLQRKPTMLRRFFAAAPGALQGYFNGAEMLRIVKTGLGAGGIWGAIVTCVLGILQAILSDAPAIFPNAILQFVATTVVTSIIAAIHRYQQGSPAPTPAPAA